MSKLLDTIQEAASKAATYKNPDLDEFREAMAPILEAGHFGTLNHSAIDVITVYKGSVDIEVSYSVRGCGQTDTITVPMEVIEAEDPLYAAKLWHAKHRMEECRQRMESAQRSYALYESDYHKAKDYLHEVEDEGGRRS